MYIFFFFLRVSINVSAFAFPVPEFSAINSCNLSPNNGFSLNIYKKAC